MLKLMNEIIIETPNIRGIDRRLKKTPLRYN
jgi:hypothetical protein